jgi:ATP-dependent protease Clp ATPase subunit
MYDLPCMSGVRECVINEEVVARAEAPLLLYENQVGYA